MNYPKFESFHQRLTWAMEKRGYNRRQLSVQIGLANNAISWLMTNKRLPRPENLLKMAQVLQVDHLWLSVGSSNNTPPDYIEFRDRLKWSIKRQGINIDKLAKKAGMTGPPLRVMLRKNIDPHPSTLMKLSSALEVDYMWLSRGYNNNQNQPILIKDRLGDAMLRKGLSITQFAKMLNVSQPTVSKWVNGSTIPRENKRKEISKILDKKESWLFEGIIGGLSLSFTQRFIYASNRIGLSYKEIAKKLKTTPAGVLRYSKGAIPKKEKWTVLSKLLAVDKDWLFTEFTPRRSRKRPTRSLIFNKSTWTRFKTGAEVVGITTDKYLQLFMGWSAIRKNYFNSKKTVLNYNTCLSMAISFGVELDWLLYQKGQMLIQDGYYPIQHFWNSFPVRMLYLDWSRPKLNMNKLAKILSVSPQTIINYRNLNIDYIPDENIIRKIAKYYKAPYYWLSTGSYSKSFHTAERLRVLKTYPGLKNNIYNIFKSKDNQTIRVTCEKGKWKFMFITMKKRHPVNRIKTR